MDGLVYVALVYAVLNLGYQSALNMIFIFLTGLFFSLVVLRMGSILGVSLSHGIINITLLLTFPFLFTNTPGAPGAIQVNPCVSVEQVDRIPDDYDIYQPDINRLLNQATLDYRRSDNDQYQESVGVDITLSPIALEKTAVDEQVYIVSSMEKNEKRTGKLNEEVGIPENNKIRVQTAWIIGGWEIFIRGLLKAWRAGS